MWLAENARLNIRKRSKTYCEVVAILTLIKDMGSGNPKEWKLVRVLTINEVRIFAMWVIKLFICWCSRIGIGEWFRIINLKVRVLSPAPIPPWECVEGLRTLNAGGWQLHLYINKLRFGLRDCMAWSSVLHTENQVSSILTRSTIIWLYGVKSKHGG